MTNTDFIQKWLEELKTEIDTLSFQRDDIRKDFFGLIYDVANCYYRGFILLDIATHISKRKISFKDDIYSFKPHIDNLLDIANYPLPKSSHFNSLNRSLIIESWSTFELCITTFCEAIGSDDDINNLLNFHYLEILKTLPKNILTEKENLKLKKLTIKKHLTHISVNKKTDFLFKKVIGYSRIINEDKEFLLFLGKFRNTMHTNFIYYGNDYRFKFGNADFQFENGKMVKWYDPFNDNFVASPKLYFALMSELKKIWKALILSIPHKNIIQYPDNEQE